MKEGGPCLYRAIGIDLVSTIVNDLASTGALPVSVAMHAGVGKAEWFKDAARASALADGFAEGCIQAGAVWGGGETPALRGLICDDAIVLAGSALGRIAPKSHRVPGVVQAGDAIVLLASSGVHTNGLSLCRAVVEKSGKGYTAAMADGRSVGAALLDPSVIYVRFVAALQAAGVSAHYFSHITGHGWRKLMRADSQLVYRITDVGAVPEVFRYLMQEGPIELREAYATFNMGAGWAAYVAPGDVEATLAAARKEGYTAWLAGSVLDDGGRKAVEIVPLGITFEGASLNVR
jgi:phosphoribosylformylglycinamidine cyclo-ligase